MCVRVNVFGNPIKDCLKKAKVKRGFVISMFLTFFLSKFAQVCAIKK